jgi:hypothetical protein
MIREKKEKIPYEIKEKKKNLRNSNLRGHE